MRLFMIIILCFCLDFFLVIQCYCYEDEYDTIVNSIASKVEKLTGKKYDISGIDIDKAINNPDEDSGKIRDTYHTLAGYFLFLAEGETDAELNKPKGFIGLYSFKTDSIVWHSVFLSDDFSSGAMGRVEETNELNGDGKVEMIIGQAKGVTGNVEQLWIFSWDGTNGKLITQIDKYGQSTIIVLGESYKLIDNDGDGIYEIQGKDPDSGKIITYSWNGYLYGKWGKSSKYLLERRKK